MKMVRLQRADWLLLVALIVLGGGVVTLLSAMRPPEKLGHPFLEIPSTFFNDEGGTKAAYLALDRLDIDIRRLRRAISEQTLAEISGLMMLRPSVPVTDNERRLLLDWVRQGHVLVVVPGQGVDSWFEWQRVKDDETEADAGTAPTEQDQDDDEMPVFAGDIEVVEVEVASEGMNDPIFTGIERLTTRPAVRFDEMQPLKDELAGTGAEAQVIWRDEHGTAALRIEVGQGAILALGDSYPLSNVGLGEADNALLLANLATAMAPREVPGAGAGTIGFDEYHLGFEQRDASPVAIARLLMYGERGWAMAHLAALGLLALLAVAVRFGKPRDVVVRQRRRQTEFVEAAARLLDDANGIDVARRTLLPHYRQRLIQLLHLDPATDDKALADTLQRQAGIDIGTTATSAESRANVSRPQLLRTIQTLHRAVETLEHGTVASD